jgi:hypothetical protein
VSVHRALAEQEGEGGSGGLSRKSGGIVLSWALAVLGKRQSCVRMHEAGPVSF